MNLYDVHVHTAEASKCSPQPGAEMAEEYHAKGYTGIIVTDHFLNGNTRVPADLPWKERIRLFCLGYEHAAERGRRDPLKKQGKLFCKSAEFSQLFSLLRGVRLTLCARRGTISSFFERWL